MWFAILKLVKLRTLSEKVLLSVLLLSLSVPLLSIDTLSVIELAKLFGLLSLQLLWWQVMLGNRFITRLFTRDLIWINKVHQFMGTYGFGFLFLHAALIVQFYGVDYILPSLETVTSQAILMGAIAFDIALILWLTSAVVRKKISWRWWKRLHFSAYIVLSLAFLHSLSIGSDIMSGGPWQAWWFVLSASFVSVTLMRLLFASGLLKHRSQVVGVEDVADDVKRIRVQPSTHLTPHNGQFAYLQLRRFGESHPFTISHYSHQTGELSFSIKAIGPFSRAVHRVEEGKTVHVDGPFGVFTRNLSTKGRPIIFVAGGIGITPFLRWIAKETPEYLFYANRTKRDIAYLEDIARTQIAVTHVLSDQKVAAYEHGYVTPQLIKEIVDEPLSAYDFYICGPPPMMYALERNLIEAGVSPYRINTERFHL